MKKENIISIRKLKTVINEKIIHKNINLDIIKGEIMLVIGGSGCGKSVLFKSIIGLIKPTSGSILISGVDITKASYKEMNKVRKKFGVLFQGAALFDSLTVKENIAFGLRRHTNFSDKQINNIVKERLSHVGLKNVLDLYPSELSSGMQKRVGLARAIALNPEIVLYDEPTTGLDPIMSDIINDLILQLQNELNITSLVVTHDMTSAFKVANRIAMLHDGHIIEVGKTKDIKHSTNPYVHQFILGKEEGPLKFE